MKLFRLAAFAVLATAFSAGIATAQVQLQEGKEYTKLKNPQPTESGNKVEVLEFFSFGCPHCRDLEPHIGDWAKRVPADVSFRRVPVAFQPHWKGLSKIFFTLESMGEVDKFASAVFDAVHRDGRKLQDAEVFYAWAKDKGMDIAKVKAAYEGFAVDSKLRRADQLTKSHAIESVPVVIVDGKYVVGSHMLAKGHAGMPEALDYMVAKARKERKS
jgi:protein dithiol oxidoreductase (disulfide-forming)